MPWYTIATIIAGVLVDLFTAAIVTIGVRAARRKDIGVNWLEKRNGRRIIISF